MPDEARILLIIGAQRAGTSFLFELLAGTDGVRGTAGKESRVLIDEPTLGVDDYLRRAFGTVDPDDGLLVDATPEYVLCPDLVVSEVVARPRSTAAMLVREPLDRIVSQYHLRRARREEPRTLRAVLEEEMNLIRRVGGLEAFVAEMSAKRGFGPGKADYVGRSAYHCLLRPWLSATDARVVVLRFEDLIASPRETAGQLLADAGFERPVGPVPQPANPSGAVRSRLVESALKLARTSQRRLGWRVGSGIGSRLESLNRQQVDEVRLPADLQAELEDLLAPSVTLWKDESAT